MMKTGTVVRGGLVILCTSIIAVAAWKLTGANQEYVKEEEQHRKLMEYRPDKPKGTDESVVNQSILDLQSINPDVTGWITVPDTMIDYPFVWAEDYKKYLRTNIYGESSIAGSIFLDYRFDRGLSDFTSILYGHYMNNGSMFGQLKEYREREFFLNHKEAFVYLPYENVTLEAVSCVVTKSTDEIIYGINHTEESKQQFISKIINECIHGSDTVPGNLTSNDHYLILSTCSYDYQEARTVVIFRMVQNSGD